MAKAATKSRKRKRPKKSSEPEKELVEEPVAAEAAEEAKKETAEKTKEEMTKKEQEESTHAKYERIKKGNLYLTDLHKLDVGIIDVLVQDFDGALDVTGNITDDFEPR